MKLLILLASLVLLSAPAQASDNAVLDQVLAAAVKTFDAAASGMSATTMGVDNTAFGDALRHRRFQSPDGTVAVNFVIQQNSNGDCAHFAAYVGPVDDGGGAYMFFCPQFFLPGADALRVTTVLHEMVHIVAGPDECRAMAYTARLQQRASGTFQPVAAYWNKNGCNASRYSLPN